MIKSTVVATAMVALVNGKVRYANPCDEFWNEMWNILLKEWNERKKYRIDCNDDSDDGDDDDDVPKDEVKIELKYGMSVC